MLDKTERTRLQETGELTIDPDATVGEIHRLLDGLHLVLGKNAWLTVEEEICNQGRELATGFRLTTDSREAADMGAADGLGADPDDARWLDQARPFD